MAKLVLKDGTRLDVVQANLWDAAAVQKEMGWKAKEYAQTMNLAPMQTALSIYATLRRNGHDVTFQSCADLRDVEKFVAEPGDLAREAESEGEESSDPSPAAVAADDPAA